MNYSKIAVRYSKALFEAAEEQKNTETIMHDLRVVQKTFEEEQLRSYVNSPVLKNSQKKSLITELFEKILNPLSLNLLLLLLDNNREAYLPDIVRNFEQRFKESRGIKTAEFTVAKSVDQDSVDKFRKILEETFQSKIELEGKIRPGIIGGFILKVNDHQYDASIATGLKNIRKKLLQTSIEKPN